MPWLRMGVVVVSVLGVGWWFSGAGRSQGSVIVRRPARSGRVHWPGYGRRWSWSGGRMLCRGGSIKSGRKTGRQFSRRGAGGRGGHALMGWLEDGDGKGWRLVGDGSLQINPETQAATATGERGARAGARGQGRAKGRTGQWEPGQWFSAPQKREG